MKTRCPSFLPCLVSIAFISLALLIGDRTIGETGEITQQGKGEEPVHLLDLTSLQDLEDKEGAQHAAEEGVQILLQLLTDDPSRAEELGFTDTSFLKMKDGAEPLTLARIFPIYTVSLNDLRAFVPNTNEENLLSDTQQLLISIEVNKQVMSSMTIRFVRDGQGGVEQKGKGASWHPTRWGLPNLIKELTAKQQKLAPQKPGFVLSIPSLNRKFLGYKDDTVIKLVPLATDYLFTEGNPYPAKIIFERLSTEAKSVDDSPR